ncbi:hypothetical protein C922_04664 [Plasmodium inui San Antonio 1]|uniref:Serine/threonine-protein phosphatase n=1 Tax=Plasmodium inui San Antonio 1 TaxID=1237626 RepID=W6ZVX0_9APIC|nr:hypothetical protein C922_04664 [Plasmodium inui San Antonio 1]EUD64932.1 hypothetical protein C922_04664 [Plasmodium inui San Antonio 1]
MRNFAETRTNRPYVTKKDSLYDALPRHPCVIMPQHPYPANTYARGYHTSASGALLKGGMPNGSQAIPTAQINNLTALKMGRMGSHETDWARRSCDGGSQANLAKGSASLLHRYENGKQWPDDRTFVDSSGVYLSRVDSPRVNSSAAPSPEVYHLSGEGNPMGNPIEGRGIGPSVRRGKPSGRSISELTNKNQGAQTVTESHAGCFPRMMEKIYTGEKHGEDTGKMKIPPLAGMEHTKGAPLMNGNLVASSQPKIRREVFPPWWGQRTVGSPSREAFNYYTLPNVRYDRVGPSARGMMGVVLVPVNGRTKNGSTKWDQSGKEAGAGLVNKWSSGRLSRTSEYSYKDVDPLMYGGMAQGRCYPDDASVESLPRNIFPWGSNEGFLPGSDSNHCEVVAVGGSNYESGAQWYGQTAVRRLSQEGLQRGVMPQWHEGGYSDGLENQDSIPPEGQAVRSWSKDTNGVTAPANEKDACEEDADRSTQCTYNKSDFTQWVSHNKLVKNIISSHNGEGHVERYGLYSLLFDAYGHNKEAFGRHFKRERDSSMDQLIGRVVPQIEKGTDKEVDKESDKDTEKDTQKSNGIVEKIIFLKFLFNQYAHTEYPNFISFKCFKTMFEFHRNVFSSEKIILFIFNCLDRCRRYYVSETDFLIGMLACSPQMENDITKDTGKLRHQLIFRAYDLDRDGYWSREEMFVFLYHLYELSKNLKHMALKGNKKKMKKFVAVERDKLMRKCEKVSYDHFYRLVLNRKVEGTQNLLRSNCDVANVVKTYFLCTYGGGRSPPMSVDAEVTTNSASVQLNGPIDGEKCQQREESLDPAEGTSQDEEGVDPLDGTQLKGCNVHKCSSAEFSGQSTTGDPNSEEARHISATSIKGDDDPEELVQREAADSTGSSKNREEEKSEERIEEQSGESSGEPAEEPSEEPSEEQSEIAGEAVEEPPCCDSNETPKGIDLNSEEKGDKKVDEEEKDKMKECGVSGSEANVQLMVPPGERPDRPSSSESIPHFGGGHEEEGGHNEERPHKENPIHKEEMAKKENPTHEEQRASRMTPQRSWRSCVEKIKEIVKAYRKKYLTDRTKLFGLNQDVAFKIFTTFYKVSYKKKREKYNGKFDTVCTAACNYNDIILLCDEAAKVLKGEDSIEYVDLPCKVFGDLHGNIFDLLDFFNMYNWPLHGETNEWLTVEEVATTNGVSSWGGKAKETLPYMDGNDKDVKYVFLGNYINRGKHSLEVICLLLSLKILFPKHIYLLRGNHEERLFNYVHGFYADIENKMERNIKTTGLIRYQGEVIQAHAYELFNRINDVLEFLPLSVLLGGNILCVHAGIGDSLYSVEDFADVHKPIVVPQFVDRTSSSNGNGSDSRSGNYERLQKIIIDTLWSDPINYDDEQDMLLLEKLKLGEDIIPSSRGKITLKFGQRRLSSFLKNNKLKMVIRGHECVQEGYRYSYSRRLLTLFSATNYCGRYGNDAANAFIVKRGKSIVIFNQILKCPREGQLEGTDHAEERAERTTGTLQQLEPPHMVNRNAPPDGTFPKGHAPPYPQEPLHWGDFPHEVGQPKHGALPLRGHGKMSSVCSPSEVPPLTVENWRSSDQFSRVDQIGDASPDRMGSQPDITMRGAAYSVRTLGGEEEEEEEEEQTEELSSRRMDEQVTPFDPNEKEFTSDGDAVERTFCDSAVEKKDNLQSNQSNLLLRDNHPIIKRKLRDTRSNEDMNWGVAAQLERREGVSSRFVCNGRDDDRDGDPDGVHFLSSSRNSMRDDHSNGDAREDNCDRDPLRKSISANGTFSSEESLYGGCLHGSSGRNYTSEMFSSKLSHFKGEDSEKGGIEDIEKAQNRQQRKPHLKRDAHWEEEYLYNDYEHCLDNLSQGDALKNPPCDEPDSNDEHLCASETKQESRVSTNAIIEKFFQNRATNHGSDEHIYIDHLEDKEMQRGDDLNHSQCAKLTPLFKRTNDVNVQGENEGAEWEQNGSCDTLMNQMMSKPMEYMMMPPDLGLANRPKLRQDTHSSEQKGHNSATLRSLRSLRSENNTRESLSKLQMQFLPPDPKPQTKISLQKIMDKLKDDA